MKTYTFKLLSFGKNKRLHAKIDAAGVIWNHLVKLQARHRALFYPQGEKDASEENKALLEIIKKNKEAKKYPGKPFSAYRVYNRLQARRQKDKSRLGHMLNELNTGAVQNLTERLERAFNLFFSKWRRGDRNMQPVRAQTPGYYPSFTLKAATKGYKFVWPKREIVIMGETYKFHEGRIPRGTVKTVTVKRDKLGDIYVYAVSDESEEKKTRDPRPLVGIDMWLSPALTLSDGGKYEVPAFYHSKIDELKAIDRGLSRKRELKKAKDRETGECSPPSAEYTKLRMRRLRLFRNIANKRREHHIQLARELAKKYGTIAVPEVPIQRLAHRARKSRQKGLRLKDLGYSMFLSWLERQCLKTGTTFIKIPGRSQLARTCHECGHVMEKTPGNTWTCQQCGKTHDREFNVAKNIEKAAIKEMNWAD